MNSNDITILSIETATDTGSVAITKNNTLVVELSLGTSRQMSRKLFSMINTVLRLATIDFSCLDAVAVSSGPGSFTGLRMGMATAKSVAYSLGIPVFLVPTFDSMVLDLPGALPFRIKTIIDAKKAEIYTAEYSWDHAETRYNKKDEEKNISAINFLSKINVPTMLVGDVSVFYDDSSILPLIEELAKRPSVLLSTNKLVPRAANIASLAEEKIRNGEKGSSLNSSPHYIRKSYAEV